jgi:hypothetical protein
MSAADKSKSYIPLAGLALDGWSTEDEATATCFCGAVQLAFVPLPSPKLKNMILIPLTADPRSRPRQHIHLQLHRLPQNHCIHVRIKLHHRRQISKAPPWSRKLESFQPI